MSNSRWVYPDALRIAAIAGVIAIHVTAPAINDIGEVYPRIYWWLANLLNSASRWSVPVFVMVSGTFLLRSDRTGEAKWFYANRLKRLLLPFLLWALLFFVWDHKHSWNSLQPFAFLQALVENNLHYHFWFVYMIIGVYLIAPVLQKAMKHAPQSFRIGSAIICIAAYNVSAILKLLNVALGVQVPFITGYIGYFILGYYLSIVELRRRTRVMLYIIGSIGVIVTAAGHYALIRLGLANESGSYFYNYCSLPVAIAAAAIYVGVKHVSFASFHQAAIKEIHLVGESTYTIYLSHLLFVELLYGLLPWNYKQTNPLMYTPLVTLYAIAASLMAHLIARKVLRKK